MKVVKVALEVPDCVDELTVICRKKIRGTYYSDSKTFSQDQLKYMNCKVYIPVGEELRNMYEKFGYDNGNRII